MSDFYSKGPWKKVSIKEKMGVQIVSSDNEHICSVNSCHWQNNIGNAKLIEKAPELLEYLKNVIPILEVFLFPEDYTKEQLNNANKLIEIVFGKREELIDHLKKEVKDLTETMI